MDARLAGTAIALFLVGYAQATPAFVLFGVKANMTLALAAYAALSFGSAYECALLAFAAAAGVSAGMDFGSGILFFGAVFAAARTAYRTVPWQPFLAGAALVTAFSFVPYLSFDISRIALLAPAAAREALYNLAAFAGIYALVPRTNARHGRRHQF